MKSKNIFFGVLLITIGILWMLRSLELISFSWWAFLRLWPLILVWIGIKIIPMKEVWKISLNILVLIIGIALLFMMSHSKFCCWGQHNCSEKSERIVVINNDFERNISAFFEEEFENAHLNLTASAGRLSFTPSQKLFSVDNSENFNIKVRNKIINDKVYIDAEIKPENIIQLKDSPHFNIFLTSKPVWTMNLVLSATAGELDLSAYKIRNLTIESNASAIDLKLGDLYPETVVNIESNASAVNLKIPKNTKCIITKETTLSPMDLKGFTKQSDGSFVSNGAGEAEGSITVSLSANVSALEVIRY
jgi:hypothetical protein